MPVSRFHCCLQSSDLGDERLSPRGKGPPWGHPGQPPGPCVQMPPSTAPLLWATNLLGTDEPNELGSSTQPALSPPCPKCACCRDEHCKYLHISIPRFVSVGDVTCAQGLSYLIFPFLHLQKPIKVFKIALLFL